MRPPGDQNHAGSMTRRRFLALGMGAAGASLLRPHRGLAGEPRLTLPHGAPRPRVVQVRSSDVVRGPTVHPGIAREMLEEALTALTNTRDVAEAWRAILRPEDVVGLKFNQSGQDVIHTTGVVADALVSSIIASGWSPERIVCLEAPSDVSKRYGTRPPQPGYEVAATDFGSGSDHLSSAVGQVTALIDIPFLKSHRIAGMSCSLKNLSHGLIKHPARFHANGCSPYVADIVGLPAIHRKLRLCLVDALRVVYDEGPEATEDTLVDEGVLIASFDPVATDSVGLGLLNDVRHQHGHKPIARSPADLGYLAAAHQKGLGVALSHGIDLLHRRPN